jgi:colanic acid/amylovoran biosynthesis glycosyltransferase
MKIAFFMNVFPLLSETFILNQITGLIDLGYQVDIYAGRIEKQSIVHDDVVRYRLDESAYGHNDFLPRCPRKRMTRLKNAFPLLCSNYKTLMPLLRSLNVLSLGKNAISLNPLYKTAAFARRDMESYDIVHCHFGQSGNLGALLKYTGIVKGKLLTTFYGYDITGFVKKRGDKVYRLLFDQCDRVYALSHVMRNQLIRLGCSEEKAQIHRLGVTMDRFVFSPRYRKENGRIDLFTPARLVEKKGLSYAIRAVGKLTKKYPGLTYRIAGDGELREELEALIKRLDADKQIHIIGWKTQDEIIELLKNADILLAPSDTARDGDQEGTPTVLVEALAQGLPVVSTYHSGIPEIVENGKSGYLVPERNADALAEKLDLLIENHDSLAAMGREGREHVEKHFDVRKLNLQLERSYKELLAAK